MRGACLFGNQRKHPPHHAATAPPQALALSHNSISATITAAAANRLAQSIHLTLPLIYPSKHNPSIIMKFTIALFLASISSTAATGGTPAPSKKPSSAPSESPSDMPSLKPSQSPSDMVRLCSIYKSLSILRPNQLTPPLSNSPHPNHRTHHPALPPRPRLPAPPSTSSTPTKPLAPTAASTTEHSPPGWSRTPPPGSSPP